MIGGLAGTVIMDLVMAGLFWAMGMPVELIYSFIGKVADSFLLMMGIGLQGGVPLGAFVHFALGLGLGAVFAIATLKISALQIDTLKKALLFGAVYIEIVSQPILLTAPLLVKMTASDLLQWYGLSTGMHLIYGLVLGYVVYKS